MARSWNFTEAPRGNLRGSGGIKASGGIHATLPTYKYRHGELIKVRPHRELSDTRPSVITVKCQFCQRIARDCTTGMLAEYKVCQRMACMRKLATATKRAAPKTAAKTDAGRMRATARRIAAEIVC